MSRSLAVSYSSESRDSVRPSPLSKHARTRTLLAHFLSLARCSTILRFRIPTPPHPTSAGGSIFGHPYAHNLLFLAYLPQLGARLHLTHTQLNVFAVAGNSTLVTSLPCVLVQIHSSRGLPNRPILGENRRREGSTTASDRSIRCPPHRLLWNT